MRDNRYAILGKISSERDRQIDKWGNQQHPDLYWLGILLEEVGEVSKNLIEDGDIHDLKNELIQSAAVIVAWLETVVV